MLIVMSNLEHKDFFWLVPIIILFVGLLPMPYGYYTMSRIIVCLSSIYFSYKSNEQKNVLISWIFIIIAILYNPIIPIYFNDKFIWIGINIPTALMFYLNRKNI